MVFPSTGRWRDIEAANHPGETTERAAGDVRQDDINAAREEAERDRRAELAKAERVRIGALRERIMAGMRQD